jgi:hypothetical protein
VRRPLDLIFDRGRRRTGMSGPSDVRRGVRINAGRFAIVKIMDDRLVAEDSGTRGVFPGRIHQPGIGRMDVVDRLMPPSFIAVHAGASFALRSRFVSDDCMLETIPGVGESG